MAKEKDKKEEKEEQKEKKPEIKEVAKKAPFFARMLFWIMKSILKIIIGVIILLIVSLILAAIGGILMYNFYTIKTANLCMSNEAESLDISCQSNSDCMNNVLAQAQNADAFVGNASSEKITAGLDLINGFLDSVFKAAASCNNGKCELKKVRGIQETFENKAIECTADEEVLTIKITPKMVFSPSTIKNIAQEFLQKGKIELPSMN